MKLLKSESYKRGVILSSVFNVGSKSIALLQQLLLAYYFGANMGTDIFFFTYNIILLLSYFFLNLTTSVLIPESMRLRHQENENNSMRFLNVFILLYSGCGILFFLILGANIPGVFGIISQFSQNEIANHIDLIICCLPIIILNFTVYLLTEILASYKYFTIPNIVNTINYSIGLLFIILFHDYWGLKSIAIGLSIGYFINLIFILFFLHKTTHWNFFIFNFKGIRPILSNSIYTQLGYCFYIYAMYIPQYIFSSFSAGSLTAVTYAEKISNIPGIFLVGQIVSVMGIKLNTLIAQKNGKEAIKFIEGLFLKVSSGLAIIALLISAFSFPITKLLFDYGKFDESTLSITAQVLGLLIIFLPFTFEYSIIVKLFHSIQKLKYVFILQLTTQGMTVLLYWFLLRDNEILNYPICKIIPYMISVLFLILFIKRIFVNIQMKKLLIYQIVLTTIMSIYIILCINTM